MPHGEFFEIGVAEALAQRTDLQEETLRSPGTTLNLFLHVAAAMAEEVEWQGARADADGYLDTARDDALTRYVASEYGIVRHGATAARVVLEFGRDGSDATEVPAGAVVSGEHLGTRVRFTTDAPVTWGNGDTAAKFVGATAVQVGPESNVPLRTITTLETTVSDPTIEVTHDQWAAGGNLGESDEDLVARVRDFGARQVRGTLEAVRLGALEVPAVRSASVAELIGTEMTDVELWGYVVVVSDASGIGNESLSSEVRETLRAWRPVGVPFAVDFARITQVAITVIASWDPGVATADSVEALKAAIRARVNQLKARANPEVAEDECLLTHAVITEVRPTVPGLKRLTVTTPSAVVTTPPLGWVIRAGEITVVGPS